MNLTGASAAAARQVNATTRTGDCVMGHMVGGGIHWSFDGGVLRQYKNEAELDRKRKKGTPDDQASLLHRALGCLNVFKGEHAASSLPPPAGHRGAPSKALVLGCTRAESLERTRGGPPGVASGGACYGAPRPPQPAPCVFCLGVAQRVGRAAQPSS